MSRRNVMRAAHAYMKTDRIWLVSDHLILTCSIRRPNKCPYYGHIKEDNVPAKIAGIIPPLTTPFDQDGEIDEKAFRRQVKFLVDKGVHGVCVGGSTGEGHTLTADE